MRMTTALVTAIMVLAPVAMASARDEALAKAIAAADRTPAFVARDKARKPQEELEFFDIKPSMTVVEIAPGGGYWTEILAPYLHDKGTYYAAMSARQAESFQKKLAAKAGYEKVKITQMDKGAGIAPAGSADLVLTFRNVHNWIATGEADQVFASFFTALKPGGVLGIEDHRASNDQPQDPKATSGYVREDYAIALAQKAGFKYLGKSEILSNTKDTKDYEKGVWTLPPVLTLGEQDRGKYLAIGEADNFVLKFEKPKK
jgi:predicted methyltransferase